MTFKVMLERCDQCLFGPDKIVSNARRSQILREIRAKDNHFICHKTKDVACRGDFDQNGCGQMGRIAGRLGAIAFVTALSSEQEK
ncbi:MAG: hypothetical protein NT113_13250 [Hyphomicrobiales bacterium]|nr:hypothetical protein [Hyphomicrobiales bacterium]